MLDEYKGQTGTSDANGQSADIDGRGQFLSPKGAEGDFQIVFEHAANVLCRENTLSFGTYCQNRA